MFPEIRITHDLDRLLDHVRNTMPKQVEFTAALTLTMTGQDAKAAVEREMEAVFDRITPFTRKGFRLIPATRQRLEARVVFRPNFGHDFLRPQIVGGGRELKTLEKLLQAFGAEYGGLPRGAFVVPAIGARLDRYGNVDRGQIIQVLSQLRITLTAGYTRNMAWDARSQIRSQRRAGGRFFLAKPGGGLAPGVYQREFTGSNITPIFAFVRAPRYRKLLRFEEVVKAVIDRRMPINFQNAWTKAQATRRADR